MINTMKMKYREKMKWYNENYKKIYNFEPKSFWNFKKNTNFDKSIKDSIANETIRRDLQEKKNSLTYNKSWGARKSLSKFNSEYGKKIVEYFTCENDWILDIFGGRTRYKICNNLNRNYIGFEINSKYIDENELWNLSIEKDGLICDDCINIQKYFGDNQFFDLLFTCPPYWNMEVYSKNIEGDISNIRTYNEFLVSYKNRLEKAIEYIKEDGLIAIVIADFRKNGKVIPFHYDTYNIITDLGWNIYDTIILEMNPAARHCYYSQAITKRRMLTTHEYLLIFNKTNNIEYKKFEEDYKKIYNKEKYKSNINQLKLF